MSYNIFSRLKANLEFYSAVERRLAECILADPTSFISKSMSELAAQAGVSQGSINNFSKKLTGEGFAALKLQIARQLADYEQMIFSTVKDGDGVRDVMSVHIEQTLAGFNNTLELNSEATLRRAAEMILAAKRIEIYGIYLSSVTARFLQYQLMQLGLAAVFVDDVLLAPVSASMLDGDNLVIAVSTSGKTKDIIDAVNTAKSNGTPILSLTGNPTSLLTRLSDCVISAASSGAALTDSENEVYLSMMLTINSLCSYIRSIIDKDGSKRYYRLREIVNSHSIND